MNGDDLRENMLLRHCIYSTVLAVIVFVGAGRAQVKPTRKDVLAHRLPRVDWIRTPTGSGFRGLFLRIGIDRQGHVTSAEVTEGPSEFRHAASKLAMTWRYKPFEQGGTPHAAMFTDFISILPLEKPARPGVTFPAIHDWASLKITLKRTSCFGDCPAYQVQILGSGDVHFQASLPTAMDQHGRVSRRELERLLTAFRTANYYGLEMQYRMNSSDLPTSITSISIDGKSMSVEDYGGLQVGMPTTVRDLESVIDEVAGTSKWLPSSDISW